MTDKQPTGTGCGFVAIVGKPNAGKSTLFNRLIKTHLSPVTHKPQTTRSNIRGILTVDNYQIIWVDTPGLHQKIHRPLNRILNKNVHYALNEVDLILMVVVRDKWLPEDEVVLERVQESGKPCILIMNKMDQVEDKATILPMLEDAQNRHQFEEIFPLSALRDYDFSTLIQKTGSLLPQREFLFAGDQISDQNERFLAGELIREQAMRELHDEIPYLLHLKIEEFKEKKDMIFIHAIFFVEKEQQRPIVIGNKGEKLKRIGTKARKNIESLLGRHVYLKLWVKVNKSVGQTEESLLSLYFSGR